MRAPGALSTPQGIVGRLPALDSPATAGFIPTIRRLAAATQTRPGRR
jgi:hypothetical protein